MESDFIFLSWHRNWWCRPLLKWNLIWSSSRDIETDVVFLSWNGIGVAPLVWVRFFIWFKLLFSGCCMVGEINNSAPSKDCALARTHCHCASFLARPQSNVPIFSEFWRWEGWSPGVPGILADINAHFTHAIWSDWIFRASFRFTLASLRTAKPSRNIKLLHLVGAASRSEADEYLVVRGDLRDDGSALDYGAVREWRFHCDPRWFCWAATCKTVVICFSSPLYLVGASCSMGSSDLRPLKESCDNRQFNLPGSSFVNVAEECTFSPSSLVTKKLRQFSRKSFATSPTKSSALNIFKSNKAWDSPCIRAAEVLWAQSARTAHGHSKRYLAVARAENPFDRALSKNRKLTARPMNTLDQWAGHISLLLTELFPHRTKPNSTARTTKRSNSSRQSRNDSCALVTVDGPGG
jgi:hypothetical protein